MQFMVTFDVSDMRWKSFCVKWTTVRESGLLNAAVMFTPPYLECVVR